MARSSRLSPEQRAAATKLRRAGLTKAKSPNYIKRVLRQPEMRAVVEGRAKAVKMSAREAKRYKDRYTVKGRSVIVPQPAGGRVYSRRGQVIVEEPTGEKIRIPPPGGPLRAGRGELWTVTVSGNVSGSFTTRAGAENFARVHYPKARAAGVAVDIVFMRQTQYETAIRAQEARSAARRLAKRERERAVRAAVRAAVRPIR